eukprot:362984-Chlamydomonas_euryale.AAC.2
MCFNGLLRWPVTLRVTPNFAHGRAQSTTRAQHSAHGHTSRYVLVTESPHRQDLIHQRRDRSQVVPPLTGIHSQRHRELHPF